MSDEFEAWYAEVKRIADALTPGQRALPSNLVSMNIGQMIDQDDGELATFMSAGYTPQEVIDELLKGNSEG